MYKRLLALFLVAMLVLPATAIATGKSDADANKPVGKNLDRQDSQAATADDEDEDGKVGTKNKRERDGKAGRGETDKANIVSADDNDSDDATSTPRRDKPRKSIKRLKDIGFDGNTEDTDTKALRKAEKEADKAARKALKELRKAEKRALKEERRLGSIDSSGTIDNSGTADSTRTAWGLQRAAAAITANIERMVAKFGDGTKNAQVSLTRVLNKFNAWIELILAGGKKNPWGGSGDGEDTSTPNSDDDLECDEDTETSGTAGS